MFKTKYANTNTCYFKTKKPRVPEFGQSDQDVLGLMLKSNKFQLEEPWENFENWVFDSEIACVLAFLLKKLKLESFFSIFGLKYLLHLLRVLHLLIKYQFI